MLNGWNRQFWRQRKKILNRKFELSVHDYFECWILIDLLSGRSITIFACVTMPTGNWPLTRLWVQIESDLNPIRDWIYYRHWPLLVWGGWGLLNIVEHCCRSIFAWQFGTDEFRKDDNRWNFSSLHPPFSLYETWFYLFPHFLSLFSLFFLFVLDPCK